MTRTEAIRNHAVRMIASDGFQGMSLRALASACGLQPGSIYTHFRSKQQLLAEVLVEYLEDLLQEWRARKRVVRSPTRQLQAFIDVYVAFQSTRADEQRILQWDLRSLAPVERAEVTRLMEQYRGEFMAIVSATRAPHEVDREAAAGTARMFISLMISMSVEVGQNHEDRKRLTSLLMCCAAGMMGKGTLSRQPCAANVIA